MSSPPSRLPLTLIVAASPKNGIGTNGTLPWRLPREMAYFKHVTSFASSSDKTGKNAVVMGRNTWESIPTRFRPLAGRVNVVISRSASADELGIDATQDTHLFSNPTEALTYLRTRQTTQSPTPLSRIFLIGGAQLYAQALQEDNGVGKTDGKAPDGGWNLDRLLVTRILKPAYAQCDVFLPEFRTAEQISSEAQEEAAGNAGDDDTESAAKGGEDKPLDRLVWQRSSPDELEEFAGGAQIPGLDSIRGVQEEKGTSYEFQMWTRVRQ
ncbi:hypothetical protein A4X13_0g2932 [Tilletia indica]|uniref:Dihydrofolate reductase n=1 Tax=Tilletia indica TaxID=43049 RepID=A0A177TKV3_9BASI|nr:hypothetical protein A4X13_0g2932 [Tilletia indica]